MAIAPAVGIPPTPETYDTSFTPVAGTDDETIASPDEIGMEIVVEADLCACVSESITQRTYTPRRLTNKHLGVEIWREWRVRLLLLTVIGCE